MNQDPTQVFPVRWQTLRPWLTTFAVIWFLGFVGLGWLIKSFLFIIGFITIAPIIGFIGLKWWVGKNIVQGSCPVCQYEFTAIQTTPTNCPNCNTQIAIEDGKFQRVSAPGTIDVQVVEVTAQVVEDDN